MEDLMSGLSSSMQRRDSRMSRRSAAPASPQLTPQQKTSVLGHIGGGAVSGLSAIGNILDLPGSSVRDAISGHNPFDQWLPWNWMTDKHRVTGREMLRHTGVIAPRRGPDSDNWGNWTGGLTAEIALDPLTYFSFGTSALLKNAAGQATKALKLTPAIARGMQVARNAAGQAGKVGNALARTTGTLGDALVRPVARAAQPMLRQVPDTFRQLGMPLHRAKEVARYLRYGYARGAGSAASVAANPNFPRRVATAAADAAGDLIPRSQRQVGPRLGDVLSEPVGAVVGGTVPFLGDFDWKSAAGGLGKMFGRPELGANLGRGKVAQAVAKGMDFAGGAAKASAPVRLLRQHFDPSVLGKYTKHDQEVAEIIHEGFAPAQADAAMSAHFAAKEVDQVYKDFTREFGQRLTQVGKGSEETFNDLMRHSIETGSEATGRTRARSGMGEILHSRGAPVQNFQQSDILGRMMVHGDKLKQLNDIIPREVEKLGGQMKFMGDLQEGFLAQHFPRHVKTEHAKLFGHRIAKTTSGLLLEGRESAVRHIPTSEIQKMIDDDALRLAMDGSQGGSISQGVEYLMNSDRYSQYLDRVTDSSGNLMPPREAARDLAGFINKRTKNARLYNNDIFEDVLRYQRAGQIYKNALQGVHEFLSTNVFSQAPAGADTTDLASVFKDAGMQTDQALEFFRSSTGNKNLSLDQIKNLHVPQEAANAVKALLQPQNMPEFLNEATSLWDNFNNLFKNSVTVMAPLGIPMFPAFFARNFFSGQFNNLATGAADNSIKGMWDYAEGFWESIKTIWKASQLQADVAGRSGGYQMSLAQAMDRDPEMVLMIAHGVLGHKIGFEGLENALLAGASPQNPFAFGETFQQIVGPRGPMPAKHLEQTIIDNLVQKGRSPKDAAEEAAKLMHKPLIEMMPGGRGLRIGYHHAATTGGKINQWVEYFNRAPLWHYYRKKGYSARQAAREIKLRQFDYSDLAPTEQKILKRLIPFYTFSRKMTGLMGETLMQRPGGAMGQTIRASARAHESDALVPDYVAETTSIPINGSPLEALFGKAPEGTKRYITGFGLGHEDPASFLSYNPDSPIGGTVRTGVLETLSRLTPLLKAPLEWGTGQTFFQRGPSGGRALSDLDPTVNRTIANISDSLTGEKTYRPKEYLSQEQEFLLANSPISRVLSSVRQASDPRKSVSAKAVNMLTGMRLTDISEAAQDAIAREKAQDLMGQTGAYTFKRSYFPKHELEKMDPQQRQQALLLQLLMNHLADRSKARKKERDAAKKASKRTSIGFGF